MRLTVPKTMTYADIISCNLTAATEAEYDYTGSTTYNPNDIRKVSFDADGTTHRMPVRLYRALISTASYPPDNIGKDAPEWEDLGSTNRYMMFDSYINTMSVADGSEALDPGKIVFEINSSGQDTIGLFNIFGTTVSIKVKDGSGAVIATAGYDLSLIIHDWEEYFYSGFDYENDLIYSFPRYLKSSIEITIEHSAAGKYPGLGFVIPGKRFYGGITTGKPDSGIMDFSTLSREDDGTIEFSPGAYAKTMKLTVRIDNNNYDKLQKTAALVRGRPTMFEGLEDQDYSAFQVVGFIRNFDLILDDGRKSTCNLEIEGII